MKSRLSGHEFAHGERRDDVYAPTHLWRHPDICCPHERVRENKVPETTAHSCWTLRRLFSVAKSSRMFTSTCLPKIQCPRGVYGTRDALQEELEKTMVELGFQLIVSTLCFYFITRRWEFVLWDMWMI